MDAIGRFATGTGVGFRLPVLEAETVDCHAIAYFDRAAPQANRQNIPHWDKYLSDVSVAQ
jgi:hypothetical protein